MEVLTGLGHGNMADCHICHKVLQLFQEYHRSASSLLAFERKWVPIGEFDGRAGPMGLRVGRVVKIIEVEIGQVLGHAYCLVCHYLLSFFLESPNDDSVLV